MTGQDTTQLQAFRATTEMSSRYAGEGVDGIEKLEALRYNEAQITGGLSVSDVAAMWIPQGTESVSEYANAISAARRLNIPIKTYRG
jgi:hypothetical protein